jgi:23S rRNA (guanosine2251-2'-O)-methyltransferase
VAHPQRRNDKRPARGRGETDAGAWLWGWHAVLAALDNPARATPERLLATPDRARALEPRLQGRLTIEIMDAAAIDRMLGRNAVHQGLALKAEALASTPLDELAAPAQGVLVMVDQVTDPQNIGAVFRSAAAFGARGVILQDRHAPPLAGAAAKAAAGAIEQIRHAREVNLARALEKLEAAGWRAVGLDAEGEAPLDEVLDGGPTALVLGSEDEGLRRLVREHCDVLARIPMSGGFESLNVSAAAAVALYAAQQAQQAQARRS